MSAQLLELADRAERATGPDRELDGDIYAAAFGWEKLWNEKLEFFQYWKNERWVALGSIPGFTASIDAAMSLVPEGCPWKIENHPEYGVSAVVGDDSNLGCATPALALCAASLRARAAAEKANG